jgi:arginine decarboxylase
MNIHVASGIGTGPTTLAAFDEALNVNGIANYNLLYLSSVIPPQATVTVQPGAIPAEIMPGTWGDRLYVVMAEQRTDIVNEEVWAGIGWVQDPETKKGLFVEHEGHSEASVRNDIEASLRALMKTRGIDFGEINMAVKGAICDGTPICAMVVAAYQASDWDNRAHHIQD